MPSMYVGYIQYGAPVSVGATPVDPDYWLQRPIRGDFETMVGRESVPCDALHGVLLSPLREYSMRVAPASARLNLALKTGALTHQLVALLGDTPEAALDFAPGLKLAEGHGKSLARFTRLAVCEFDRVDSVLSNAITVSAFEQFVMIGLLLSQPHNFSEALRRLDRPILPRDVKRAIDDMEVNLDTAIGLPEIVAASGVPGRTLFKHFRDFRGISPMRYLREARFKKVREALRRAEPHENVIGIALSWGFGHMGRFASEYRQRFGENPSETLRSRTRRSS
jgi:AraC-like DNA-binding protein